ncbi:SDR family NAD(P)-dependent oxidoreductase [Novosphingobium taihuense]|uniref:NAD(P)-dependent dehydrogenase (Short-subunit alcohol dehydrogenase family) n=1 Tax=Novosphingobium taihuense TaxID=260085 RepID=A0A7W7ABC3_9SPHN|nr:SDR family oxidoreductase [Novosphingobium taihuense]MBB4613731.1 NAD(P)-dependent dehydrogenase (short-subunit alcohol dehydrogenase family) [Novosphingobium taihuense]TWH83240.1 NAD(P)-dependent dehydrogenase (short-subunit alcohol dehydrogenase family) [Novosphingobium taihuense]
MQSQSEFSGRTALVTGAASGIGAATARWLDACGIGELILVDLDRPALDQLGLSCKFRPLGGDVSDPALWKLLERELTRLDYAVLNAGIATNGEITELDIASWRKTMAVNLDGMFLSLRTALRAMKKASSGAVVLTASVSGIKAAAGTAAYSASKAATIQLAKVAAAEAAKYGVRVNAIAPGGVDTGIWDRAEWFAPLVEQHGGRAEALAAMAKDATPLGRFASADEVAAQIGFLLSDVAATITGTCLVSDGGVSL